MSIRDQLICALDVDSRKAALQLVESIGDRLTHYKVGSKLFTRHGPAFVEALAEAGARIFLDLKFHDIPNTVRSAVAEAAGLPGVVMTTIHASGGRAMIRRAADAAEASESGIQVVAVTALTSLDGADIETVGGRSDLDGWAVDLGRLALDAGADGLVCSAREAAAMRRRFGDDPLLVTPGIRPPGVSADDQKRVMTPGRAVAAGSDYLVVGRPIYRAEDPAAAVDAIVEDMERA